MYRGDKFCKIDPVFVTYSGMFIQNWTVFCSLQVTLLRMYCLVAGLLLRQM